MTKTTTEVEREDPCAEVRRGRGRPRARCDEETRAVIFDAARHEFAASGYAATSMESVARRAGVSTKTLYRLVPNKAALFEGMITDRIDTFASVVRLRACDGDVEKALYEALIVCGELEPRRIEDNDARIVVTSRLRPPAAAPYFGARIFLINVCVRLGHREPCI